jgi:hypothetical protein
MLVDKYGRPLNIPATASVSAPSSSPSEFLTNYARLRELRKQGVTEDQIRLMGPDIAQMFSGAGSAPAANTQTAAPGAGKTMRAVTRTGGNALQGTAAALRGITPLRAGLAGGALMAIPSLMEGRPAEAVGGIAGSAAGGAAGAALGTALLPGVGTVLGGIAGSALGGMLGGGAAEAAVSAYTGKPPTGKAGVETPQPPRYIDTPMGRINLNDAAAQEDFLNRNQKRQLDYYGTMMGMTTSNMKDLTQFQNDQEINMQKSMLPITTKLANDQLTRAQAMVNTQNNAYLQQMAVGAQANLALGAQRERGATMRQVLATNPYTVALSSPNISIS